jgi:hypothetical protein
VTRESGKDRFVISLCESVAISPSKMTRPSRTFDAVGNDIVVISSTVKLGIV